MIVRRDVDAVGVAQAAVAPASEEVAVGIENEDGRVLALIEIHGIARVYGDVTHGAQRHARGQDSPRADDLIDVVASADDEARPATRGHRGPRVSRRPHPGGPSSLPSGMTTRPRTIVQMARPRVRIPSKGVILLFERRRSPRIVSSCSRSRIAMSASAPTWIVPFRGWIPQTFP